MQGPAEIWLLSANNFEATLGQVGEDQWTAPTGCGDWTVRDLVDHALFWQCNLASLVGAQVTPEDGWDTIKAAIVTGLENPSALDGAIEAGLKIVELESDDPLAHTNLSILYQAKGMIQEAEDEKALAMQLQLKAGSQAKAD